MIANRHRNGLKTMETPRRFRFHPEVGGLSVPSPLNYQPWFAIAEFVDNRMSTLTKD